MKKFLLAVASFSFFQFNCTQKKTGMTAMHYRDTAEHHAFFPVTEYLKGQLRLTDSMPITPLKIISSNGKTDSIWMKKKDIRPFAEPFLHPLIDTGNLQNLFTERSFLDQTINAVTISYDPSGGVPDSLQLKKWDVYFDPNKNTVSRIYIVKEINNNGVHQTLQLTWKSGQWCKITTISEEPGKPPAIKEETMKWDFNQ